MDCIGAVAVLWNLVILILEINNWFLNIFAELSAVYVLGIKVISAIWICYSVELIFVHVYLSLATTVIS